MKICIVRHGETEWNHKKVWQGRKDVPLNEAGIMQAKVCADKLKNEDWKHIVTSPLIRAYKTAQIISDKLNVNQIEIDAGLTERGYGDLEGVAYTTVVEKDEYDRLGVEPKEKVLDRIRSAFFSIAERYYPSDIIIVTHGCVIKSLLTMFTEIEEDTHINNCSISVIEYDGESFHVKTINMSANEIVDDKM